MLTVCYFKNHSNLYKLILILNFKYVKLDMNVLKFVSSQSDEISINYDFSNSGMKTWQFFIFEITEQYMLSNF